MAIKFHANLHRNRYGVLYFRIGVPKDLRPHFLTSEIYRSLRTASIAQATSSAQILSSSFKVLFRSMRNGGDAGKEAADAENLLQSTQLAKATLRPQGQPYGLIGEAEARLESQRYPDLRLVPMPPLPCSDVAGRTKGRNLSSWIAPYLESLRKRRRPPAEQTIRAYETSALLMLEIVGDKPLAALSYTDRNRYDDVVVQLPKNRQKHPSTRGRSIAEMLEKPGLPLMSLSTVRDEGLRAQLFLSWVGHQEGIASPVDLLKSLKVEKSDTHNRRPFSDSELSLLFDPDRLARLFRPSPFKLWVPLIALHSGARLDEIAQMRTSDVHEDHDVPYFHINEDHEGPSSANHSKRLKTAAARRVVPIASQLLNLGFLDHVKIATRDGSGLLFPDLAHAKIRYGSLVSKWFARYCDALGLIDPALTFHSFRHGAVTLLTKKGVQRELRQVIVGHSGKRDVHDDYVHTQGMFSIRQMLAAVDNLDFSASIDYSALKCVAAAFK